LAQNYRVLSPFDAKLKNTAAFWHWRKTKEYRRRLPALKKKKTAAFRR